MLADVDVFGFIEILHFVCNQGNQRKVEPSARLIKMDYKGILVIPEVQQDLEIVQIELDVSDPGLGTLFFVVPFHFLAQFTKKWIV